MRLTGHSMHRCVVGTALVALGWLAAGAAQAGDTYDAAVAHSGRSQPDIARDALDHPADLLRLAGIKPGMHVADILGGGGYYSELVDYIVGPKGHVLLINNAPFDHWSDDGWVARLANSRLPNVEHRTVDLDHMDLGEGTLDAVLLVKVYHDLYWVADDGTWPVVHPGVVLDQISHALKPGGVLLLVDHSAKPGTGASTASTLHRIDEAFARQDWTAHGLRFAGASQILRRPDDARDQVTYEGPMVGKTDRFVLVFRKGDSR